MTKPEVKISLTLTLQEKDQQLILEGDEFIFGRNEKSDVIIRDPSFSRSHLKIFLNSENKVCISDLGSPNGTFINGQRISSHGTSHIRTNDIISIDNSNTRIAINKIEIKALEQVGGNDLSLVISKITEDAKLKAEAIIQAAIEEAQRIHREQEIENKKKISSCRRRSTKQGHPELQRPVQRQNR